MSSEFSKITPVERIDYRDLISHVSEAVWPEFMFHDPVAEDNWDGLFDNFGEYQFALLDRASGKVAGIANSAPLRWEGELEDLPERGWDWAMEKIVADFSGQVEPNLLCGLQIAIEPGYQGAGLSKLFVRGMVDVARSMGFPRVIVPVRPSLKDRYPLSSIDNYITWTAGEGLPFDPWLRVHVRSGGRIIKPCHEAMEIVGTIAEWEEWTGMRFFESGAHIIAGALVPVVINLEGNSGTYIEPNVWVVHDVV